MEKKMRSISTNLPPVKLYLDDVRAVAACFENESVTVSLETESYQFADAGELAKLDADEIYELQLEARDPYITLECRPASLRLSSSSETSVPRAIYEQVLSVLLQHRRSWVLHPYVRYVIGMGLIFWLVALPTAITSGQFNIAVACVVSVVAGAGCLASAWRSRFHRFCIIVPRFRTEAPGFWKRKRDDVLLVLIGALVGTLLTLLVAAMLGK